MTFDELIQTLTYHKDEVTITPEGSTVRLPFKERFLIRK
jgi:hypothetical protein